MFGRAGIKNGMKRRMDPAIFSGDQEMEYLTTYVYQMMIKKKSSEIMVNKLIKPFVFTHKALEEFLPELRDKVPMAFMYGEYDWVDREVGDRLVDSGSV